MSENEPRRSYLPKGDRTFEIYPFHKSPDGEDCLEKTYHYTKYCTIGGSIFSFYEMVLNSKPSTVRGCIARFGRFTLPFAAMGFTFGTSLCLLGKLRGGKTDIANHCISGALAGTVWGFKYNSISVGHTWAVYLGLGAAYYMFFHVNNLPMFPMRKPESRQNYDFDFTIKLYDDPGRPSEM